MTSASSAQPCLPTPTKKTTLVHQITKLTKDGFLMIVRKLYKNHTQSIY
ncbi:hypothetical protein THERMOT_641 [Bathymodiolus thermophilus thioautotrophic gill symbiont]|nr:hypothetical protein THERMOT_641 [Bathymodiolus thermophilus thioautotrophic gill symbiont]